MKSFNTGEGQEKTKHHYPGQQKTDCKSSIGAKQYIANGILFIPDGSGARSVLIANIVYIESLGNFTKVYIKGEKKAVISNLNLLKFEHIFLEQYPQLFFRITRQLIIGKIHVARYDASGGYVTLKNKQHFKLSKTKISGFKLWLGIK